MGGGPNEFSMGSGSYSSLALGIPAQFGATSIPTQKRDRQPEFQLVRMPGLHSAIERYDNDNEALLAMLACDPGAAAIRSVNGDNAVDMLWKRFVEPASFRSEASKTKAAALKSSIEAIVDGTAMQELHENKELNEFWEAMLSFIKAASLGDGKPSSSEWTNVVHDCVKIDCDPLLTQLAIALYPDQSKKHVNGRLPIHLIQSSKSLKILLEAYPDSASTPDPDGRLPLHLAIERNIAWEEGLEALIKAYPGGLNTQDPKTGLLPSLMAQDATTIFQLISANPSEPINLALFDRKKKKNWV